MSPGTICTVQTNCCIKGRLFHPSVLGRTRAGDHQLQWRPGVQCGELPQHGLCLPQHQSRHPPHHHTPPLLPLTEQQAPPVQRPPVEVQQPNILSEK